MNKDKFYRMRFAFIIFLLLPIAGQAYVMLRTWQLLPAISELRMVVVVLMALAFITFFIAKVLYVLKHCDCAPVIVYLSFKPDTGTKFVTMFINVAGVICIAVSKLTSNFNIILFS